MSLIINRLVAIKSPSFVHRMPRSTEDLLHWKASEFNNWFFYYALPVIEGIMQREYFEYFSLLIAGISLLNLDSITNANVDMASNILHKFVREFEVIYDLKNCSINVHRYHEDLNGQYLNVIKGTRHIDSQLVRSAAEASKIFS